MNSSRVVLRTQARAFQRHTGIARRRVRFASQDSSPSANASPAGRGFAGGLAGGILGATVVGFAWYKFSGAGQAVKTAQDIKGYTDSAINRFKIEFKDKTPSANEALDTLRSSANKYAVFIPGGKDFVNKAFEDIDTIRNSHGEEVDKIVGQAYEELRDISKQGLSFDTASESYNVLSKYIGQLSALAVDAGQDVLNNHPELKNKLGGSYDQLKQLGDKLGPDAKKQVDQTYQQIREILQGGIEWNTVDRIRKLVEEKTKEVKKLGESAWQQGLDQIQPLLEKNPKIKQIVEENSEALRGGNIQEGVDKVKEALMSGESGSLEEYLRDAKSKASEQFSSESLNKWLSMIPGGDRVLPQLEKLRHIAEKQGPQAEKLAKETLDELMKVFEKKKPQLEELYNETEKETKRR